MDDKVCPLFNDEKIGLLCCEEKCAWWCGEEKGCAVMLIAQSLANPIDIAEPAWKIRSSKNE